MFYRSPYQHVMMFQSLVHHCPVQLCLKRWTFLPSLHCINCSWVKLSMSSHGVVILHSLYCSSRDQSLGTSSSPNSSMQKQHVTRQTSLLSWRYGLISLIHWEFKARPLSVLYLYLCVWGVCFYTCMIWVCLQERTRTALLEVLVQELARKTNELSGTSSPGPVSSKDSRNFMDNIKRALSKKEPRVTESSTRRSNGSASLTPVGEDQSASVRHSIQLSYNVNNLVIVYSHPKMLISL